MESIEENSNKDNNNVDSKNSIILKYEKKHNIITIMCVLLLMFFLFSTIAVIFQSAINERVVYKKLISNSIKNLITSKNAEYKSIDTSINIDISTKTSTIKELLDGIKLNSNIQYDKISNKAILKINIDRDLQSYLKYKSFIDIDSGKIYFKEENISDKMFTLNIEQRLLEQIEEKRDMLNAQIDNAHYLRLANILSKVIDDNFNDKYFSNENTTINVLGSDISVKDNILKLSTEECIVILQNIIADLENNEEFLLCFEDRNSVLSNLEKLYYILNNNDINNEDVIQIHCYTSGVFNSFIGISVDYIKNVENCNYKISLFKKEKNKYELEVKSEENNTKMSNIELFIDILKKTANDIEANLNLNIDDTENIDFKVYATFAPNRTIDDFDVENSKSISDLTEEELQEINTNLINLPFLKLSNMYWLINYFGF